MLYLSSFLLGFFCIYGLVASRHKIDVASFLLVVAIALILSMLYLYNDSLFNTLHCVGKEPIDNLLEGKPVMGQPMGSHIRNVISVAAASGTFGMKVGAKYGGFRAGLVGAGISAVTGAVVYTASLYTADNARIYHTRTITHSASSSSTTDALPIQKMGYDLSDLWNIITDHLTGYWDIQLEHLTSGDILLLSIASIVLMAIVTLLFIVVSLLANALVQSTSFYSLRSNPNIARAFAMVTKISSLARLVYFVGMVYLYFLAFSSFLLWLVMPLFYGVILPTPTMWRALIILGLLLTLLCLSLNSALDEYQQLWVGRFNEYAEKWLKILSIMKGDWDRITNYFMILGYSILTIYLILLVISGAKIHTTNNNNTSS